MDDGYRLPLSVWPPTQTYSCRAVLLALHGLNDYRNAFADVGPYLAERGVTVYAYDQRGFGESEGAGYWHGWQRMVDDLQGMITLLRRTHPDCPLYVLGESMGGGLVLAAQREKSLDVSGEILVAPAVWSRDTMPWYQRAGLWFAVHTLPGKRLTGEGLDIHPSDNIAMLRALGRDPKVIKATRIDVLYGVTNLMDVAASVPTARLDNSLLLYGAHDEIIPRQPTCQLLNRLQQAPESSLVRLYPQGYHMLTRDLNARVVLEDVAGWLLSPDTLASDGEAIDGFCRARRQ
jgi:alpha-beta hydrolase superfamily lysophospholipase